MPQFALYFFKCFAFCMFTRFFSITITNLESGKKNFEWVHWPWISFCIIKTWRYQLKVCQFGFIKKDKFELHLRMTNKTITNKKRDLVRNFFSSSRRFSPGLHRDHCRKVDDFWLQWLYCPLGRHDSGCCLQEALARWLAAWNLVRVWFEYAFPPLSSFLENYADRWVSQSV